MCHVPGQKRIRASLFAFSAFSDDVAVFYDEIKIYIAGLHFTALPVMMSFR